MIQGLLDINLETIIYFYADLTKQSNMFLIHVFNLSSYSFGSINMGSFKQTLGTSELSAKSGNIWKSVLAEFIGIFIKMM